MKAFISDLRGVLLLETSVFERMRSAKDGILRALVIVSVVALIVAIPNFVSNLATGFRPFNPQQVREEILAAMRPFMQPLEQVPAMPKDAREQFKGSFEVGANIGAEIAALHSPLPRPAVQFLGALGGFLSSPFTRIGSWLAYLLWVMFAAKLLGGAAGMRHMIATTSLASVPQVLNVFGFVPCFGLLIGVVAFLWSVVVYVKAIAVANGFDGPRAALAVLLPIVVFVFGAMVAVGGLIGVLAITLG